MNSFRFAGWVMLAVIGLSLAWGMVLGWRKWALVGPIAFGLVNVCFLILLDPGPSVGPGLVGWPMMCVALAMLGDYLVQTTKKVKSGK